VMIQLLVERDWERPVMEGAAERRKKKTRPKLTNHV